VNENVVNGTTVGFTAIATDNDATTSLISYSLINNAAGRFAINSSTGVVSVADGTLLNHEAASQHTITVRATSQDGSISSGIFTITIDDINERPTANQETFFVRSIDELRSAAPGVLVNDTDPDDGDVLTVVATQLPASGTISLLSNGSLHYVPGLGLYETVTFQYYVTDGLLNSDTTTSTIYIYLMPSENSGGSGTSGSNSQNNITSNNDDIDIAGATQTTQSTQAAQETPTIVNVTTTSATETPLVVGPIGMSDEEETQTQGAIAAHDLGRLHVLEIDEDEQDRSQHRDTVQMQVLQRDNDRDASSDVTADGLDDAPEINPIEIENIVLTTVIGTGVVIWIVQGAQVLATVMSAAPVWMQLDPLLVMSQERMRVGKNEQEEKAMELFDGEVRRRK
jgi:hypothetical protein